MSKLCVSLIAFNAIFLGGNMDDLQMAAGCFACVLRSWNLLSNWAFGWKMKPFIRETGPQAIPALCPVSEETCNRGSWITTGLFPLMIWRGWAAADCTVGGEDNALCSSSCFGLNQKGWTSACLVAGSKCLYWCHLVGKQLKQSVVPRSFKQKSKHHFFKIIQTCSALWLQQK